MALKRLAIGAAALSAARAMQTVLTFLALPLLARLLPPSEFGLVALAMAFVVFTLSFSDAGLGQSLVRTPPEDQEVWSSAFWMIALLSGSLSVLLLLIAWPAGWLFGEPRLAALVWALAPLPLVQGMIAPAIADLQQRENFLTLAAAEAFGALAGTLAAVWVAFSGGGAWALVAQQLAMWSGKAVVVTATTRLRPSFMLKLDRLGTHVRFGRDTAGWSLLNFLSRQVDPLVIAKFMGTTTLGFYSVAYRLMNLPMYLISGPIQSTLYSRMVRLHDNPAALRSLVFIATRAIASFVFPPLAVLAVSSAAFMHVFLSERWEPAAALLSILLPVGALQTITALNGAVLMSIGRTDLRLRTTFEFSALWLVLAPALAMTMNITAVALGYTCLFLAYLPRTLQLFLRPIGGRIREYVAAIAVPLLVAAGLVFVHLLAKSVLPMQPWTEIGLAVSETLIGYGITAWALRGRLRDDISAIRGLFTATSPSPLPEQMVVLPK